MVAASASTNGQSRAVQQEMRLVCVREREKHRQRAGERERREFANCDDDCRLFCSLYCEFTARHARSEPHSVFVCPVFGYEIFALFRGARIGFQVAMAP